MQNRVGALIDLSEGLLALARADAPTHLDRVELAASALAAVEQLEDAARALGKHLKVSPTESWVSAESEGLLRVLVNLIENAIKYGSGEVVTVRVEAHACTISHAGEGPPRAEWARLLQPFERGAGAQGVPGSGLGLALVAALAGRWDAELTPEWTAGGFAVRLSFAESGQVQVTPEETKSAAKAQTVARSRSTVP